MATARTHTHTHHTHTHTHTHTHCRRSNMKSDLLWWKLREPLDTKLKDEDHAKNTEEDGAEETTVKEVKYLKSRRLWADMDDSEAEKEAEREATKTHTKKSRKRRNRAQKLEREKAAAKQEHNTKDEQLDTEAGVKGMDAENFLKATEMMTEAIGERITRENMARAEPKATANEVKRQRLLASIRAMLSEDGGTWTGPQINFLREAEAWAEGGNDDETYQRAMALSAEIESGVTLSATGHRSRSRFAAVQQRRASERDASAGTPSGGPPGPAPMGAHLRARGVSGVDELGASCPLRGRVHTLSACGALWACVVVGLGSRPRGRGRGFGREASTRGRGSMVKPGMRRWLCPMSTSASGARRPR